MSDLPNDAIFVWPTPTEIIKLPTTIAGATAQPTINLQGRVVGVEAQSVTLHRFPTGEKMPRLSSLADACVSLVGNGTGIFKNVHLRYGAHALRVASGASLAGIGCTFEAQGLDPVSRQSHPDPSQSGQWLGLYRCTFVDFGTHYVRNIEGDPRFGGASRRHAPYVRADSESEIIDCVWKILSKDQGGTGWAIHFKNLENAIGDGFSGPHRVRGGKIYGAYGAVYGAWGVDLDIDGLEMWGGPATEHTLVLRAHRGTVHVIRHLSPEECASVVPSVEHFAQGDGVRGFVPLEQPTKLLTLVTPDEVTELTLRFGKNMTANEGMDGDTVRKIPVPGVLMLNDLPFVEAIRVSDYKPRNGEKPPPIEVETKMDYKPEHIATLDPNDGKPLKQLYVFREDFSGATLGKSTWTTNKETPVFDVWADGPGGAYLVGVTNGTSLTGGNFVSWIKQGIPCYIRSNEPVELTLHAVGVNLPAVIPPGNGGDGNGGGDGGNGGGDGERDGSGGDGSGDGGTDPPPPPNYDYLRRDAIIAAYRHDLEILTMVRNLSDVILEIIDSLTNIFHTATDIRNRLSKLKIDAEQTIDELLRQNFEDRQ